MDRVWFAPEPVQSFRAIPGAAQNQTCLAGFPVTAHRRACSEDWAAAAAASMSRICSARCQSPTRYIHTAEGTTCTVRHRDSL